jgi:uroporphyrin-III C-methyltransferase/precorrin-2 dehydrogenase/sirohydrochlorin ferrochelatase
MEPYPYPLFLKLAGRRVLVVGGGSVADAKTGPLLEAGALVTVVAPDVCDRLAARAVRIVRRAVESSDLDHVWLVVAAATPAVNREVARAAEARRLFVNAVDDPAHASAYAASIIRRSGVTVAISTNGDAPALSRLLREGLEDLLPADLEDWMDQARGLRRPWREEGVPMDERRHRLLAAINRRYEP